MHVEINSTRQTVIVQEGVNVNMDCLPWLSKFGSGGIAEWYMQDIDINANSST